MMDNTCYRSNLQEIVDHLNAELANKRLRMEDVRKQTRVFKETVSEGQAIGMKAAQERLRQLRDEGVATPESKAVEESMEKIEKSASSYRLNINDLEMKIQLCKRERDRVEDYSLRYHQRQR
jgi:flagellar biosynthesis/type III secretory pathway protein FliH